MFCSLFDVSFTNMHSDRKLIAIDHKLRNMVNNWCLKIIATIRFHSLKKHHLKIRFFSDFWDEMSSYSFVFCLFFWVVVCVTVSNSLLITYVFVNKFLKKNSYTIVLTYPKCLLYLLRSFIYFLSLNKKWKWWMFTPVQLYDEFDHFLLLDKCRWRVCL